MALTSGWAHRVRRQGRAIALSAGVWGLGIIGFGFATSLPVAIVGLALAGGGDMVSGLFRGTMWNQSIPDALRGRLAGIEMLSYSSGPALGNVEAGLFEALAGLRVSIVAGRAVRGGDGGAGGGVAPLLEVRRGGRCVAARGVRGLIQLVGG